jgi:hypothetical protein
MLLLVFYKVKNVALLACQKEKNEGFFFLRWHAPLQKSSIFVAIQKSGEAIFVSTHACTFGARSARECKKRKPVRRKKTFGF